MKRILAGMFLVLLLGCEKSSEENGNNKPIENQRSEYTISKASNSQPKLVLERIENTEDETIATFSWDPNSKARVWPPGHDKAFFLTDVKKANKYHLLDVEGISVAPKWSYPKSFRLTFERIPDDLKRFHVVEGNLMSSGAWNILNVKLEK